jgi:MoaA/NifB/PqqE/SkfB family radical SAM enzyme
MSRRIVVSPSCAQRCPSCFACSPTAEPATLEQALAVPPEGTEDLPVVLGGGDATKWPFLHAYLAANGQRPKPERVWVEAPARAFTTPVLRDLKQRGVEGIRVQIEALGDDMIKALGVGDGLKVIAEAEELGLQADARACVRPKTLPIVVPLARQLSPRFVWVEIYRQDWGKPPTTFPVEALDRALATATNVRFSGHRVQGMGYPPPCTMPVSWRSNHRLWQATFAERQTPNTALPICGSCSYNNRCQWSDPNGLSDATKAAARPVLKDPPVRRLIENEVPEIIVRRRRDPEVICTEPWTTLEMTGHDGNVHQCGGNWSDIPRGSIYENSLMEIWNGPGFEEARHLMGKATVDTLCNAICTRLYDGVLHEKKFKIRAGSEVFVKNQLLLAEEIAERKEIIQGLPTHMSLCPSTYCNYNCVFCDHGRRQRWDMPERIWEELPLFLPTLKTLTLLGGEPFANSRVWEFLTTFDTEKYPDVRLDIFTNGGLMTEKLLRRVRSSSLGEITISLNSGAADVYEKIENPSVPFDQVLKNVDALIRFRDDFNWWFGITLSLIVMRENSHTLIRFGQLALERNLHMRLVGLLVDGRYEGLNYYKDPDAVTKVVADLDEFIRWATHVGRPDYVSQAKGAREAVIGEAQAAGGRPQGKLVPLQIPLGGARAASAPA